MPTPEQIEADLAAMGDATREANEALALMAANLRNAAAQAAAAANRPTPQAFGSASGPLPAGGMPPQAIPVLQPAFNAMGTAAQQAANALGPLGSAAALAANNLANNAAAAAMAAARAAAPAATPAAPAAPALPGAAPVPAAPVPAAPAPAAVPAASGGIAGALGGLVGPALALKGAFGLIEGVAGRFVAAINPYLMEQVGVAFNNISATIGSALEPAMGVFLDVLRQANSIIAPLAEQLRGVFAALAADMAQRLMPVFKLMVEVWTALLPAFAILHELMRPIEALLPALANVLRLVVAVVSGLFASFGDVLSPLKDAMDSVVNAMKDMVKWIIVTTAQFAAFLGLTKVVDAIKGAFSRKAPDGKTATVPAQISDFASILKDATISAFTAQGEGTTKGTEDWLGDIYALLEKSLKDKDAFATAMAERIAVLLAGLGLETTGQDIKDIAAFIRNARNVSRVPTPREMANIGPGGLNALLLNKLMNLFGGGG